MLTLAESRPDPPRCLYNLSAMGRLRHRAEMPSAGPSPASTAAARALSQQLLDGIPLAPWPGGMNDRLPGEVPFARWVGPRGMLHARDFSWARHWRSLYHGGQLIIDVTSQRLRVIPGVESMPLRFIRDLEPRARDLSVLDLKFRTGDRLRLYGEHVPELTVMFAWLLRQRVIAVPEPHVAECNYRSR
jgi:hypothetical protein